MPFPAHLSEAIAEGTVPSRGGWYAREGETCEGAKFHSPQPLVLRNVSLNPFDPTDGDIDALLCGTCADNLGVLQELFVKMDGDVPWPLRREFGNQIRALAERGWKAVSDAV